MHMKPGVNREKGFRSKAKKEAFSPPLFRSQTRSVEKMHRLPPPFLTQTLELKVFVTDLASFA